MPIAQPDRPEGAITENFEGGVGARRAALRGSDDEVIILYGNTGYTDNDNRLFGHRRC